MPKFRFRTNFSDCLKGAFLAALALSSSACSRSQSNPEAGTSAAVPTNRADQAAGVQWSVPARWQAQAQRPMRVATYQIPTEAGDPDPAECAVYFFGTGQGGTVEDNLARWAGQFAQPDGRPAEAKPAAREIAGLRVHTIDVTGTYLAAAGPMSTVSQTKPNFAMLGAIVEAPQGLVFFKLTGPAKTVASARNEFSALLESLHQSKPIP